MPPARSSAHIRTSRTLKGFRVGRYSTGISMALAGNAALVREKEAFPAKSAGCGLQRDIVCNGRRARPTCGLPCR